MTQETPESKGMIGVFQIAGQDISLYSTQENDPSALRIRRKPTDDPDLIFGAVKNEITRTRWWMRDTWVEKGLPKEEFLLADGEHQVTLFNYGDPLERRHLDEVMSVLGLFSAIRNGKVFERVSYIVVDNVNLMNEKSGELSNGHGPTDDNKITLYPNALASIRNRVTDKASNLEGTLTHELTHGLNDVYLDIEGSVTEKYIEVAWMKIGNWTIGDKPRILPGGGISAEVTTDPDRCVTVYAQSDSGEDMCDSMVATLFDPEVLDEDKLYFLQTHFSPDLNKVSQWVVQQVPADQIKLPATPNEFKVKFMGNGGIRTVDKAEN